MTPEERARELRKYREASAKLFIELGRDTVATDLERELLGRALTQVQAEARLYTLQECEDKYDTLNGAAFELWLDREIHALAAAVHPAKGDVK